MTIIPTSTPTSTGLFITTPTPTSTLIPTSTPTSTPTLTPTVTPTSTTTNTPTPTETPSVVPIINEFAANNILNALENIGKSKVEIINRPTPIGGNKKSVLRNVGNTQRRNVR